MYKSALIALSAVAPIIASAAPSNLGNGETNPGIYHFNSPQTTAFMHVNLLANIPANGTTVFGVKGSIPNEGGNSTGGIESEILKMGAAVEFVPDAFGGVHTFRDDYVLLNTTDTHEIIILEGRSKVSYANEALHGFGEVRFSTNSEKYLDLNWRTFVAEFEARFEDGIGRFDVFEITTNGRVDGKPIKGLLPPGDSSEDEPENAPPS